MWKGILYALGTAGIFYLAVLYRSKSLLVVCFVAVLLPLLFLWILSHIKRELRFELLFSPYPTGHGGDYSVGLRVENPNSVYLPYIMVKIQVKNTLTGKIHWVKAGGKIPAYGTVELTGKIREPEFGMWQAKCKQVRCYDWADFLYLSCKVQDEKQVMIFPEVYGTNIRIGLRTRLFGSDGGQNGGDDTSGTLKLREYRKGDRMNRIHWKLSAKNEELIVAETEMPMGCNVVIFLDGEPAAMGKKEVRAYWETLNSISQELLMQECPHYLVWRDKQYGENPCRKAVRKVEDLTDFWCGISSGRMEKGANPKEYAKIFPGEAYASCLVWNQKLELLCNDELVVKITPEQVEEQLTELELLL